MSITATFMHTLEDDFEQYSFRSEVNPKQRHFISSDESKPWELSIVNHDDALTLEQAQTLQRELAELIEFMLGLQGRTLQRTTEPGDPDLAGRGGGL